MKNIILAGLLFSMICSTAAVAQVEVHENNFNVNQEGAGDHFWIRLYDWSAWVNTPMHQDLQLPANFVKAALDEELPRFEGQETPSVEEFQYILGDYEGEAAYDFFIEREEVDPFEIRGQSGLVSMTKVAVDLPSDFKIENASLDEYLEKIIKADAPHVHKVVTKGFAKNVVDSLHYGQKLLDQASDKSRIIFSVINMGDYDCSTLNGLIWLKGGADGITSFDGSFRVYNVNIVSELSKNEYMKLGNIIDVDGSNPSANPIRVFEQKMIYSSTLLKSGSNYIAIYKNSGGGYRLVLTSVLISTNKLKIFPDKFLNGIGFFNGGSAVSSGVEFDNQGVAIIDESVVKLNPIKGCSKGISKGVGRYVYELAKKMATN